MTDGLRRTRAESPSDSQRPLRRQRVDEPPEILTRDALFYKDSGDCYLQVEDHLFKIHRYHLLRGDASVFKDMFSFPSGDQPSQGMTESDPIVLAGDTAERVRAFLSIAYAEPLEFQVAEARPEQLSTLIHCAHLAHKYNITPLLLAALHAILHVVDRDHPLDWKIYVSLLEFAPLCETVMTDTNLTYCSKIRSVVERHWVQSITLEQQFPALAATLDAAEKYALLDLLSLASITYLEKMASGDDTPTANGIFPPFLHHPWLKPSHRIRILSGSWSLERAWFEFTATVPTFPPGHVCRSLNHGACKQRWTQQWERAVKSFNVVTVPLGQVSSRVTLFNLALAPAFTSPCISAAFSDPNPVLAFYTRIALEHFSDSCLH
ncbi:hypothetical protein DFH09DRAFT_231017 [Mycena vulgaris]|nr:hypothetical protein DFH09DRAFT_231017 [Mycena vulgaris]